MTGREQLSFRRRRKGLVFWLFVLTVLLTGFIFIHSNYFKIGQVVVEGNKYMTVEDIYKTADIPATVNIFSLRTGEIKNRLANDLRIAQVDVIRRFPSTIIISVSERRPVAYVACNYGFLELDGQGIVLAAYKNLKQLQVPMITGIRAGDEYVGDKIADRRVQVALTYLAAVEEPSLNQISEINVQDLNHLLAYTVNSVSLRLGDSERLTEKAKFTNDMLREINYKKIAVDYIDLTYSSPFIKFKH